MPQCGLQQFQHDHCTYVLNCMCLCACDYSGVMHRHDASARARSAECLCSLFFFCSYLFLSPFHWRHVFVFFVPFWLAFFWGQSESAGTRTVAGALHVMECAHLNATLLRPKQARALAGRNGAKDITCFMYRTYSYRALFYSARNSVSHTAWNPTRHWLAVTSILLIVGAVGVAVPLALRVADGE